MEPTRAPADQQRMLLFLSFAFAAPPLEDPVLTERIATRSSEIADRHGVDADRVRELLQQRAAFRLERWPGPPTDEDLQRRIADFEATRLERYVTSGVFPKRYFGYLDTRGDTESWEWAVRDDVQCIRRALNATVDDVVVTDLDLVVTFLAEGGTLMLDAPDSKRDDLHPVFDVGLDDLATGTDDLKALVDAVDTACDSHLGELVVRTAADADPPPGAMAQLIDKNGGAAWLVRMADMRDAIAGTAVMWVWEVRIADAKLRAEGRTAWLERDRDDRFIAGSLVYNSGILHSESTHRAIRAFSTGRTLYDRSERNKHRRPRLNLQPPPEQLAEVLEVGRFRDQPTSWVAVYHILQRYGAWRALVENTDWFDDDGNFRPRDRPVEEPKPDASADAPAPFAPTPDSPTWCGCASPGAPRTPALLLVAASLFLLRRRTATQAS